MSKINFIFIVFFLIRISLQKNNYILKDYKYIDDKQSHLQGTLEFEGEFKPEEYEGITFQNSTSELLTPIKSLTVSVDLECDEIIHIKVLDKEKTRWEVPYSISDSYKEKVKSCTNTKSLKDIGFTFQEDKTNPFTFKLSSNDEEYFNSEETNFLYSDYFIAFGGYLTSNDIYGFGERYHKLKLGDGIFTLWPNDTCGIHEDKGDGGYNAMGTHPLALHKTTKNNFVGIVFNNINAQDVLIKTISEGKVLLEHRTIGGIIDYYIYYGNKVDDVLIKMHDIIGHPMLPPFWSLGYHQCRWGYFNTSQIEEVMKKFHDYEIPLDTLWGDVDILQDKRIFSIHKKNFYDLPLLVYEMHQKHLQFIPIVDLGFAMSSLDPYYTKGLEMDAFILSNYTQKPLVSFVWPGSAVFPDYFSESGTQLWEYGMSEYYKILKYDGIWIDMNEPAMIMTQKNNRGEILPNPETDFDPGKNQYEYIPYVPGYRLPERVNIMSRSMSENSISHKTEENPLLTSYNFKPLLSLLQAKNTGDYLIKLGKRPFILSRSTMLGSGKYTFHWLGDNASNYDDLRNGINGIFQFQIYGIPVTGDDICGFMDDSNDALCARWMALGAFFPFSRNHNFLGKPSQEPFAFGVNSNTFYISSFALRIRYALLRYYYTQLFLVSLGKSGSFYKPAFFEYSSDPLAYNYIDNGILIGDSLYFIPALLKEETYKVYFPNSDWMNVITEELTKTYDESKTTGSEEEITISLKDIKLFLKGGSIVPGQETFHPYVSNTHELRRTPTEIFIQPDSVNHTAVGEVIFDNDAIDTLKTEDYLHIKMNFNLDTLNLEIKNNFKTEYKLKDIYVSKIVLFRLEYLKLGTYGLATITDTRGRGFLVRIAQISEHKFIINLNHLKLTFTDIVSVKMEKMGNDESFELFNLK